MKTNALKTTINLLLLLLIAGSVNSCKKEKEIPIEGKYRIEVKVSKRLPLVGYLSDFDSIDFPHLIIQGHVIYKNSSNICCSGIYNAYTCPMNYTLENVKILKEEDKYYLESIEAYSTLGKRYLFDLPLAVSDDNISYYLERDSFPDGNFMFNIFSDVFGGTRMPSIKWLSLELKRDNTGIFEGNFVFVMTDSTFDDYCSVQLPNGETKKYNMCEFAEVTFTKMKD